MSVLKRNMLWFGAVFILILSAITFVFIPAMSKTGQNKTLVFGKWNDKPIEYVQDSFFMRQIQTIAQQMESQGQEVNQFSNFQIMQTAFKATLVRFAILDELSIAGYKIPQKRVDKNLIPYYQDKSGKYSAKLYNDTPESTRSQTRAILTDELTARRYIDDVFGTQTGAYGLKTSSKETELLKTMASTERSFAYVSFSTSAYPEDEVIAYGQANPALFVKHDLSIITVGDEATAKKVASILAKKTIPFDEAVTTYSTRTGAEADGKLTASYRNDLNKLFADAKDLETVLALQSEAISTIVKADKEFAIVRCNAAPAEPVFNNASVIAAVTSYMNSNERGKIEDYFVAKAKVFTESAKAKSFDAACKEIGVQKKSTTAFGINYGNSSIMAPMPVEANTELTDAVKSETFYKTAFSLKASEVSEPILLGANVLVMQMTEEKAADAQTLEMIPLFYNYYLQSWSQKSLSEAFTTNKKAEDHFFETYLKNFLN